MLISIYIYIYMIFLKVNKYFHLFINDKNIFNYIFK
jgi:hypothetical protein